MSLSERLAFLITVNSDEAVRGFQKVGAAADKDLAKADARVDKIAHRATLAGAGMLSFAGVAAGALFKFADASEDAQHSELQLQNTLANMPKLAGENAKQFVDLATAIQNKTAADGDQIVSAEAMLGTFNLTAKQIRGVTPLVVDYSRKFGVDMVTAAISVGKALDGQIGALKRNGVSIDAAAFKTDRYGAVTQALRDQVGGFAEEEGKTFSGSLQRLRNQLQDLEEGVGKGVVGAFSTAIGPVSKFSSALGGASPQTQEFVGRILAIGTASIGALGALSLIGGQLLKMRDQFSLVNEAGERSLTTLGKFAAGAGFVAGAAAIVSAAAAVGEAIDNTKVNIEELSRATDRELAKQFQAWQSFDQDYSGRLKEQAALGNEVAKEGIRRYGEQSMSLTRFGEVAKANIGVARAMRDELKREGVDVSALDKILDSEAKSQKRANDRANDGADSFDEMGAAAADAGGKVQTLADKLDGVTSSAFGIADAENNVSDLFDSLLDKANASGKARADAAQRYADVVEQSNRRIRDAEENLVDAKEDLNKQSSGDRTDARRRVRDAEEDLADAKKDQASAIADAKKNTDDWTASLDANTQKGRENRDTVQQIVEKTIDVAKEMEKQHKPLSEITAYIDGQLSRLENVGTQIGFNKTQLQGFLDILKYAEATIAPPLSGANFAAGAFGLGGDAAPTSSSGGRAVNVFVINQAGSVTTPEFARQVGTEVARQLPRTIS